MAIPKLGRHFYRDIDDKLVELRIDEFELARLRGSIAGYERKTYSGRLSIQSGFGLIVTSFVIAGNLAQPFRARRSTAR